MKTEGNIKDIYTLNPMQEGMLFQSLYDKDTPTYFQQVSYRLSGNLELRLVKKSLAVLFERYDILKTAFVYKNIKRPVQVVVNEREAEFYYEDLREKNLQDPEAYIREFKEKDKQRSFDLTKDVLLRIAILQLDNKVYELIWDFHHIIMDGWSTTILTSEFFEIYSGLYKNQPLRLPEVKPFRLYIQWLEKQDREKSKSHWRKYLAGYEEKSLIPRLKGLKPPGIGYKNEQLFFSLQKDLSDQLNHLAVKNQVSLNTTIQALWGILLAKYNRKRDIIFGAVVSGRPAEIKGVETMVGLFINTIPVRIGYEEKIQFNELLRRVQESAVNSEPHHYYPLAEIQSLSVLRQDLIDHILAFENYPVAERIEGIMEKSDMDARGINLEAANVEIFEQTNYDFNLVVAPGDQLHLEFDYNANVFDAAFIKRIANHFNWLVQQVIKNESVCIEELTLVTGEEKAQLLYQFNDTAAGYPAEKTIHGLFEEQAGKNPGNVALYGCMDTRMHGGEHISYHELNESSNQLAVLLKEKGVKSGTIVGIMAERSVEMIAALLGILKAGGAYLPLDPEYPADRVQFMLADSRVQVLVKSRAFSKNIVFEKKIIYIEDSFQHTSAVSNPLASPGIYLSPPQPGPSNLAYIIYTSGTTGKPKGAMIEHKNVVRLMFNDSCLFDFNNSDVWTMFHSYCFDFSVWEMYGALLYGGKLIVIPKMVARDPGRYLKILKEEQVTVLNQTPSAFYNLIVEELKCRDKDLAIRYIIFGGEALKPYKLKKWKEKYPGIKFINMFGITETTVHVTYKEITDREIDLNISNIGKPIPTLCTYVVGCDMELLPTGIAGELCVGGEGVARGYLNQPELTAVKFIPNHFMPDSTSTNHGERMYRSGDLVSLSDHGEMEYLGRIDHQVQVRGFRVELEEIESQLLKHEKISETVVLAKEDENGDSYLCAYIVLEGEEGLTLSTSALREFLLINLPDYMVPSYFVFLDHIPLTPNGKIDRKALPGHSGEINTGTQYIAPGSESQKKLAAAWKDILPVKKIGIRDDFFIIGGDSIKAIRLLNRINTVFKSNYKIIDIFENSTIEQFSALVDIGETPVVDEDIIQAEKEVKQLQEEIMASPGIPWLAEVEGLYPMSDVQMGMVYHSNKNPGDAVYHEQFVYQVEYPGFEADTLKKALHLMVNKHSILRTAFNTKDFREFVQIVYKECKIELRQYDISNLDSRAQEKFIIDYLESDRKVPFNVSSPPLWRMIIFEIGNESVMAVWVFHHAILDGWSNASLMTELNNTYLQLKSDAAFIPGKLKHTYKDFIIEQIAEKKKQTTRDYWRRELDNFKRVDFPASTEKDADSPGNPNNIKKIEYNPGPGFLEKLNEAAKQYRSSVMHLCLAAYCFMLSMLSRENDIVVGLVTNNRPVCEDGDKILGCFLNSVPFRLIIPSHLKWSDYIRIVEEKMMELKRYDRIPLFEILKIIGERTMDRNPLFDTLFNYVDFHIFSQAAKEEVQNHHQENKESQDWLSVDSYENTNTFFDLTVNTTFGNFSTTLKYSNALVSDRDAERLLGYLERILTRIVNQPESLVKREELLSVEEKQKLLLEFNDTDASFPKEKTLHRLFEEQESKTPDNIAVIAQSAEYSAPEAGTGPVNLRRRQDIREQHITYRQLNIKSNQLARKLQAKGVKPDTIVGLLLERSIEMMVGIIGILKAGGTYLPIESDYPPERIKYMLADSSTAILLTTGALKENIPFDKEVVYLELEGEKIKETEKTNPGATCLPHHLAYIIYTSGTTGKPKGTMIQHKNVVRLMFNDKSLFDFNSSDVWTMFHSYCFDFSVWEMYGALLYGGELIVIPKIIARDPGHYLKILRENKVTVLNQIPSAFYNLVNEELKSPRKDLYIRYVIFGGEALQPLKLKEWKEMYPGVKLINMFGITETTVHVTYKEITDREIALNISNIGKPIPTSSTYVVNQGLELSPLGIAGELCVGGEGVSRGYLNRPGLTRTKFVENIFKPGEQLYRSGDLARISANGEMEYLGRIDHQVQVKGFRIELGEIESQLLKHAEISETTVIAREDEHGNAYLCAYVVSSKKLSVTQLREYLLKLVPDYMVPLYFVQLEKIPLTPNGKIDRKALPDPQVKISPDDKYTPPGNELQAKLAQIWEKVLVVERVGITDKYFDIGGDSIKAIRLLSVINETLNTNLQIVDLFTNETIEKLSGIIVQAETSTEHKELEDASKEIEELKLKILSDNKLPGSQDIEDIYPMSDIEKGMVFHFFKDPEHAVYHDQMLHQVDYKDFDPRRFKKALILMMEKHPILRTAFNIADFGEPLQLVYKSCSIDVKHDDISHLGRNQQEEYIKKIMARDRQEPFDITVAPLWRMKTFSLDKDRIVVLFVCHHAILDGWSDASFNTELNNIYLGLKSNPDFVPGKLKNSYKEFIIEQVAEKKKTQNLDYWKKELADFKRLEFPAIKHMPADVKVKTYSLNLGNSLLNRLTGTAAAYSTNVKRLCFGAYVYMLYMLSYESDLTVGLVTNNRPVCEDGEKMLGCFLNTVPVRLKIPGNIRWSDYIRMIEEKSRELARYDRLSLLEIVRIIGEEARHRNPIFDMLFNFIDYHVYHQLTREDDQDELKDKSNDRLSVKGRVVTNTLLNVNIDASSGNFWFFLSYATPIISDESAEKMSGYFFRVLNKFVEEPQSISRKWDILSSREKQALLHQFNDTCSEYPGNRTIHELFEEETERIADRIAVISMEGEPGNNGIGAGIHLTYRKLNEKSNQVAQQLRKKGVTVDDIIGLMVNRSIRMIVGLLGILKAGAAYLPVDPAYPGKRIKYMLQDSHIDVLLTEEQLLDGITVESQLESESPGKILLLDQDEDLCPGETSPPGINNMNKPDDLAYIIYTSGSTGKPKGVMVGHRNVVRLVKNTNYVEFQENGRILQTGALEFDASTFEIWGALLNGLQLILAEKEVLLTPAKLKEVMQKVAITTIWMTSPYFNQMLQADIEIFSGLKNLLVGGDVLSPAHIDEVKKRYPHLNVINGYGPTENTTFSTTYLIDLDWTKNLESIPIGQPIANSTAYIVDRNLSMQPPGTAGELCVGGAGVSRGYLNNPALTHEKFMENPFKKGDRFYRTGDLSRWLPDGNIEFLGRIDRQVKIRGFRIEMDEIKNQLLKHENVKEAYVMTKEDEKGDKFLCAYLIPGSRSNDHDTVISNGETNALNEVELREYLLSQLPSYMVPAYFIQIEKLPLTPNGKVDMKVLPAPGVRTEGEYMAPRDEIEKKLTGLWWEILGIEKESIGIDDDFFGLGGHSLKAAILAAKMHKVFNIKTPLVEIFEKPTIRELSQYIKQSEKEEYFAIEAVESREYHVLSSAQKRMYIMQQMDLHGTAYNITESIELDEQPDKKKLEETTKKLIKRHESLRTSFIMIKDVPLQRIHQDVDFRVDYYRTTNSAMETEKLIGDFIKPFDLSRAPLIRVGLIEVEEVKHILVVDLHHIISDGISHEILAKDFMALYRGEEPLPLRIQYKDFAQWQNSQNESAAIEEQRKYWLKEFSTDVPILNLPFDYPRTAGYNFEGEALNFTLETEKSLQLKALAIKEDATLYMVLLAAVNVLLAKLSGNEDIVIGCPVAGRRHQDLHQVIGMFVNTLVLRNYPESGKTFKKFLQEIRERTLDAFENQEYQLEDLVEEVAPGRDTGSNPLFDVLLALQNFSPAEKETPGEESSQAQPKEHEGEIQYGYEYRKAKFDLMIICIETENKLFFKFSYRSKLFKRETIEKFIAYFREIVSAIVEDPGKEIAEIEIISKEKRDRLSGEAKEENQPEILEAQFDY